MSLLSLQKSLKRPDSTTVVPSKCAEFFRDVGDNGAFVFYDNNFDFENCNITEVIMFLQNLAKSPNGSKINRTFTEHIIKALMHDREEKLKLEASIPRNAMLCVILVLVFQSCLKFSMIFSNLLFLKIVIWMFTLLILL